VRSKCLLLAIHSYNFLRGLDCGLQVSQCVCNPKSAISNSMNDLRIDDPCVLFAMNRESRGLLCEFPPTQEFAGAPCRAWFCGPSWLPILVVETGIGPKATQRALDWLLSKPKFDQVPYEPKLLLFAGFAGSLVEHLHVGDLVLATEVIDLDGNRWPTTWPGELPAGTWQPPLRRGTILSSAHLIGDPENKRRLGQTHAVAVDMESATFARMCCKRGLPFGCLRAISDDVGTALSSQLVDLLTAGRVSWRRALLALVRRPFLLKELMRLSRDTRSAADQLGKGLGELLTLTLDWLENTD
jgi:nucleoside phosphorylase